MEVGKEITVEPNIVERTFFFSQTGLFIGVPQRKSELTICPSPM